MYKERGFMVPSFLLSKKATRVCFFKNKVSIDTKGHNSVQFIVILEYISKLGDLISKKNKMIFK
jgi:hypothetical protein